ncbi:hypothetical protein TCAL_15223 [Tigriopus californicus]|uniref:Carbohydrate sulfotransferase n=2 Tax=Tigriopus californicus TaxID=6832 RepID=A0A553NEH5_TIGCA|nr:hypothetical protein TCAL_15223 [Tigriopus californicus]
MLALSVVWFLSFFSFLAFICPSCFWEPSSFRPLMKTTAVLAPLPKLRNDTLPNRFQRASHLSPRELERLSWACQEIKANKLIQKPKRANKLVDWNMKFAYSIIQKSASSSIMQILAWWSSKYGRKRIKKYLMSNDSVTERINEFDLFRFTFVRHPLERLYSAFQDKIVNRAHRNIMNRSHILHHYGPTFENFSTYIVEELFRGSNEKFDRFNCHIAPQVIMGDFCQERYHFIGRVEQFQKDMKFVLRQLGFSEKYIQTRLDIRLNSSSKKSQNPQKFQQLPKHLLVALHRIYYLDFRVFGYQ